MRKFSIFTTKPPHKIPSNVIPIINILYVYIMDILWIHTLYYLCLDFENKHNPIIQLIELYFLHNNQHMGPCVFIHIVS
jgi:hypothetical protein